MAFGMFEVHAGDFKKGKDHQCLPDAPLRKSKLLMKNEGSFFRESIELLDIAEIDIATEESVIRVGGAIGWGLVGSVLLGPVGLLAGVLAGGKGKDVTFVCKLKDGRKFLATAPSDVYKKMSSHLITF